jgi:acetyl-CoA carboxylase biotin carboxyl carrier protein
MSWDLEQIKALAALVNEYQLAELSLSNGEHHTLTIKSALSVSTTTVVSSVPVAASIATENAENTTSITANEPSVPVVAEAVDDPSLLTITSPMVGTFYASSSPENPPFVEVGQRISVGQSLCILEAMKQMNVFESEHSGVVVAVLASNQEPVEYGQPLFTLKV